MKRLLVVISTLVVSSVAAYGQGPAQGQTIGLATSLQRAYATFKQNFTQSAEKMPEADYGFKPGSTPEARPFSAVIAHIVQSQSNQCATVKGVPNPMQGRQLEQELKTKAEVTRALADAFALCDDLFAQVTDATATEMVRQGMNQVTRAAALYGIIVHGNEMYGTAAVYLRSKNLVPPSTENAGRGRGAMPGRGN